MCFLNLGTHSHRCCALTMVGGRLQQVHQVCVLTRLSCETAVCVHSVPWRSPSVMGMAQMGTGANCQGPYGNRKLPTGVPGVKWGLGCTQVQSVPSEKPIHCFN